MSKPHAPGTVAGFTLIEVVMAVALLAVVMTIVYSAFSKSLEITQETAEVTERVRQVQVITERLLDELSAAYWLGDSVVPASPNREPRGLFVGTKDTATDSEARLDRLTWTTFAHRRYVADRPESDLAEITYRVEPDPGGRNSRLIRDERVNLLSEASWATQSDELAAGVTEFRLRYLSGGEWVDEWDAAQRRGLPAAVEITVALAGEDAAPPERVRTVVPLPLAIP